MAATKPSNFAEIESLARDLGIKLVPIEEILKVYPHEFLGMEFQEAIHNIEKVKAKYKDSSINRLIKSFKSHDFNVIADIYGHNGLSCGCICKKCRTKVDLPRGDWTDNFIIAYHYVYGRKKSFTRIKRCNKA